MTPEIRPCPHMRPLLSPYLDGALRGLVHRYCQYHIEHCRRCTAALEALRALQIRLRSLGRTAAVSPLHPERWSAIETAWSETDQSP